MKTKPKRQRVRSEKSQKETEPERPESVKRANPVRGGKEVNNKVMVVVADRKTHGKRVNDKVVVSESNSSKTRGKTRGPKKIGNVNQKKVNDDDAGMADADSEVVFYSNFFIDSFFFKKKD